MARALRTLPVIRGEFAAGRMSYSKVRALTRIATPDTEKGLTAMATPMTAGQVERFTRAYDQCTQNDDKLYPSVPRKSLKWRFDHDTGGISFTLQLPPEQGAVVLQALRAAVDDLEHPHDERDTRDDVSAETRPKAFRVDTEDLADAFTEISASYLRGKIVSADNADIYQVIVHTTPEALTARPAEDPADVPAETQQDATAGPQPLTIGHPAYHGRCHIEDGPAIAHGTAQLIACTATISAMVHSTDGEILTVGRRRRRATAAIRRAVRERDGYRCTFPGCQSRRTDLHHITWWSNGGDTSLDNMTLLCKAHHAIVHDKGYIITRNSASGYTYTRPDGLIIGTPPPLPGPAGDISSTHDATITPATISTPVLGEKLDLHLAIWIALNNTYKPREQDQHTQAA